MIHRHLESKRNVILLNELNKCLFLIFFLKSCTVVQHQIAGGLSCNNFENLTTLLLEATFSLTLYNFVERKGRVRFNMIHSETLPSATESIIF